MYQVGVYTYTSHTIVYNVPKLLEWRPNHGRSLYLQTAVVVHPPGLYQTEYAGYLLQTMYKENSLRGLTLLVSLLIFCRTRTL